MGQRFLPDQIGNLTHSLGTITLAPSRLTIGGQQYTTNGLQLVLPALLANTLYMLYVVLIGGVPTLVQSTNVNSAGPAGYSSWNLVGAYYSHGGTTPGLGSFVNVEGVPKTFNPVASQHTFNAGSPFTRGIITWSRDGRLWSCTFSGLKNGSAGVGATPFVMSLPTNIPGIAIRNSTGVNGFGEVSQENGGNIGTMAGSNIDGVNDWVSIEVYVASDTTFQFLSQPTGVGTLVNTQIAANTVLQGFIHPLPIANWSNTPLKDL